MKNKNDQCIMKYTWADQLKKWKLELSKTEYQLVNYINNYPETASSLTLSELSEVSGVSKPVVIKCFRKLEFDDYKTFQRAIEQFFASQIDSLRASKVMKSRVKTIEELVSESAAVEIHALERLRKSLNPAELQRIAEKIHEARMIYLTGEATGQYPAHYLYQRMRRYGLQTLLIEQDPRHIPDILHPTGADDLLMLFHYSDRNDWLWPLLSASAKKGISTIVISDTIHPDFVSLSDMFMHIPRGDLHFKNSMSVPMHFANQILLSYELLYEDSIESQLTDLEEFRKLWDEL